MPNEASHDTLSWDDFFFAFLIIGLNIYTPLLYLNQKYASHYTVISLKT